MKFTKMHGIGNDYVYINCFEEKVENPKELAIAMSDRHFGVGSDGIVLICPSEIADFRMRMYNSDGSEAQMCGNATRCIGKYVYDRGLTTKEEITLETLAGIKTLTFTIKNNSVETIKVNMGEPTLETAKIPIAGTGDNFVNQEVEVDGKTWKITGVSMGNPHAVVYLDDVKDLDLIKMGPSFENHKLFPERINTEFVKVIDKNTLEMRVWERGAGETLACGTGACAVLVSSVLCGVSNRNCTIKLRGGDLDVYWSEDDNCVYMTGSATFVFDGVFIGN